MTIQYAGPKAMISRRGIDFDNNKEDKYVYLNIAIQLLNALNHDHTPGQTYAYDTESARLSDSELLNFITKTFENSEEFLSQAQSDAQWFVDHEKEQVEKHRALMSEAETNAWLNNIKLMETYVTQRHFNKNIYYAIIEKLAEVIRANKINEIHTPMYQKFVHVLHTLQGVLKKGRSPIDSEMSIFDQDGTLSAKLVIKNL